MQSNFCVPKLPKADVKSSMVLTFFLQWAKVVLPQAKKSGGKMGFLDFFSGPGKNDDGTDAGPVLVLKHATTCIELSNVLVTVFSDRDLKNILKLRQLVASMDGIAQFNYVPRVEKGISYDDLVSSLQTLRFIPSLNLIDPLNIKDFSFYSFSDYIKELNHDYIFQVNYSQLEQIIDNPFKEKYLEMVFGKQASDLLKAIGDRLIPLQKELLVMKVLLDCFKNIKGYHSVLLKYYKKKGGDTFFLVFITRYAARYQLYAEILIKAGYKESNYTKCKMRRSDRVTNPIQAGLFSEKKNE